MSGSTFSANAAASGGAIDSAGSLTVSNTPFINNMSTGSAGIGGAIHSTGSLVVSNSTFTGNSGGSGKFDSGGGIYNTGNMRLTDCSFSQNISGGLYAAGAASSITDCTFSDNTFSGVTNAGTLTVTHCTFVGNSDMATAGAQDGGGLENGGVLTLNDARSSRTPRVTAVRSGTITPASPPLPTARSRETRQATAVAYITPRRASIMVSSRSTTQ